jgi:hypothetical protein
MSLEDLRFTVAKLHLKPGDTLHLTVSRNVDYEERNALRDQLFRILPKGVSVIVLSPDYGLTVTPA